MLFLTYHLFPLFNFGSCLTDLFQFIWEEASWSHCCCCRLDNVQYTLHFNDLFQSMVKSHKAWCHKKDQRWQLGFSVREILKFSMWSFRRSNSKNVTLILYSLRVAWCLVACPWPYSRSEDATIANVWKLKLLGEDITTWKGKSPVIFWRCSSHLWSFWLDENNVSQQENFSISYGKPLYFFPFASF